jgi:ubiquinone/menaquinone biosynthesis C-methylase UbiE
LDLINNHIKNLPIDQNLLLDFIELYNLNALIDSNRKISGVDIFRNFEYSYPLRWLKPLLNKNSKVLDVGTSSTLWSVLLHHMFKCKIYATDIDMEHLETQSHYLNNIKSLESLGDSFVFEYQDATALTYADSSFDVVCSISAIEHIPSDGDIRAVEEFQRVLKKGGSFIFTAPYAETFFDSITDHYHHGYEKRYDVNAIENRFSHCNKLNRKKIYYINGAHENSDVISEFWYNHKLYNNLGAISMLFSLLMFNITEEPTIQTKGFMALYEKI